MHALSNALASGEDTGEGKPKKHAILLETPRKLEIIQ